MVRILNITPSMNPAHGGPPQGIRASIQAMASLGIKNEVACCDAPSAAWINHDQLPIHALGPGRFGFSYTRRLTPWLKLNAERFDVIILHGMWQWPGLALLRAAVPRFFLMPHGMLDPWFQRDASRRLKSFRNWFYWWLLERHIVRRATGLLFTCQEEMQLARTTFRGYYPKKEFNVGYGINPPPVFSEQMRTAFAEKVPNLGGKPFLLFLGRIHPKKGVDVLIQAYSEALKTETLKTPIPHLVIAGPGWETSYGKQMQQLIEASNTCHRTESSKRKMENSPPIHRVGMLDGDAKWGALYGCEAFILPSHQENFGIAVVEALACNKPVLISNKVNIWREISNYSAGIVVNDSIEEINKLLKGYFKKFRPEENEFFNNPSKCYDNCFKISTYARRLVDALVSP